MKIAVTLYTILCFFQTPPKPGETDPFEVFVENNMKHRPCRDLIDFLGDVSLLLEPQQLTASIGAL